MLKGFGIPELYSYGYNSNYNIIVMELLGQSLKDLFKLKNKKFNMHVRHSNDRSYRIYS